MSVNENHARELLELHSVGPAAGYSQADVIALSYIMAGWECPWTKKRGDGNPVKFNQDKHEPGNHVVFGKRYKQRGLSPKSKLLDVIEDLASHPSCRRFITQKLCRHFICDHPTDEMTAPIIEAWEGTDGDLPSIHQALLEVVYEYTGQYEKFQNPEVWFLQMANMAGSNWPVPSKEMTYDFEHNTQGHMHVVKWDLEELGLAPYRPIQPNGWSDLGIDWISPELLLRRLVFAKKYRLVHLLITVGSIMDRRIGYL